MRGFRGSLVLFSMLALISYEAHAQGNGAVTGMVTDAEGRPLSGVLVFVDDGGATSLTDQLGLFGLSGLSLGPHVLSYRKAGHAPRSFALDLSAGSGFRDVGALVLGPGPEPTATLSGIVTDGDGGSGLAGATVELNGRVVATTDSLGAFDAPGSLVVWGSNDVTVRHRGFADRSVSDRIWVSNARETFDLVVAVDIAPVALPGVAVAVLSTKLADEGFYQRREDLGGAGTFMTREDITARSVRRTEDLLPRSLIGSGMRRGPRSAVGSDPVTGDAVPANTFGLAEEGNPCLPIFYLDGLRMGEVNAPAGVGSGLDQLVHPEDIEGIEIYETVSELPAKFSPIGAVCGVILIWTR